MKKVISVLLALVIVLGFSVPSFATSIIGAETTKWTEVINGKNTLAFGKFLTSGCSAEQKAFLQEWMVTTKPKMLVHTFVSGDTGYYNFYIYDNFEPVSISSFIGFFHVMLSSSYKSRCVLFTGKLKNGLVRYGTSVLNDTSGVTGVNLACLFTLI